MSAYSVATAFRCGNPAPFLTPSPLFFLRFVIFGNSWQGEKKDHRSLVSLSTSFTLFPPFQTDLLCFFFSICPKNCCMKFWNLPQPTAQMFEKLPSCKTHEIFFLIENKRKKKRQNYWNVVISLTDLHFSIRCHDMVWLTELNR